MLKSDLALNLWSQGLLLSKSEYREERSRITEIGKNVRNELRNKFSYDEWKAITSITSPPIKEESIVRMLGFGYALTENFISLFSLDRSMIEAISSIGALANIIVSIYDSCIDSGLNSEDILPISTLQFLVASNGKRFNNQWENKRIGNERFGIEHLVGLYFQELASLATLSSNPNILSVLSSLIYKMYISQNDTASKDKISSLSIARKSSLPFIVMGLPAAFLISDSQLFCQWKYLRWLYEFGALYGAIDDIVDFDDDQATGQPNSAILALSHGYSKEWIVTEIVNRANAVLNKKIVFSNTIFRVLIISWMGGEQLYEIF